MRHALKLTPLFLFVFLVMTACSSGNSSQAREELARLNVEYSDANFIENARQGNADVVHHFLDARSKAATATTSVASSRIPPIKDPKPGDKLKASLLYGLVGMLDPPGTRVARRAESALSGLSKLLLRLSV